MKLLRLIVICVLILNVFFTSVFAADIDCKNAIETCPPTPDPCACKSNPPSPVEVEGPAFATAGSVFAAKAGTGRAAYLYSIDAGSINELTGEVTAVPACPQTATVTVTDACDQEASMSVELGASQLTIGGPEDAVVGSVFGAGGGLAPYTWSFAGGSIDDTGKITAIDDCSGPDTPRWATVAITDSCGQSASMEVRLPGGGWQQISYEEGECYKEGYGTQCADHWAYDTAQKVTYCANYAYYPNFTEEYGGRKETSVVGVVYADGYYRNGTSNTFLWHTYTPAGDGPTGDCSTGGFSTEYGPHRVFVWKLTTYEWVCQ